MAEVADVESRYDENGQPTLAAVLARGLSAMERLFRSRKAESNIEPLSSSDGLLHTVALQENSSEI